MSQKIANNFLPEIDSPGVMISMMTLRIYRLFFLDPIMPKYKSTKPKFENKMQTISDVKFSKIESEQMKRNPEIDTK